MYNNPEINVSYRIVCYIICYHSGEWQWSRCIHGFTLEHFLIIRQGKDGDQQTVLCSLETILG